MAWRMELELEHDGTGSHERMKGTLYIIQLEECGDLDMELHCILMGNRVDLFVGFAPRSQSKGFSAPFYVGFQWMKNAREGVIDWMG